MNKEKELALVEKYPELLKEYHLTPYESCLGRGIECWDGWYKLIDDLCKHLKTLSEAHGLEIVIEQIKSKFARLTVYYCPKNEKAKEMREKILEIINMYSIESQHICEMCGKTSTKSFVKRNKHGWVFCLCDTCLKKREEA